MRRSDLGLTLLVLALSGLFQACASWQDKNDNEMAVTDQKDAVKPRSKTVHFISYGDNAFTKSRERIRREAQDTGWFNTVEVFTPETIAPFIDKHKTFFAQNRRGGGYWIWKSYIIQNKLANMQDGEYLVFADAGCTVKPTGKARFNQYLSMVENSKLGVLAFEMHLVEKCWTKADLFRYLNVSTRKDITDSGQRIATVMMFKKSPALMQFIDEYSKIVASDNYHNLDDTPSQTPNDACFTEHRHDQSIFSVLSKIHGAVAIPDETPNSGAAYPFHASRLRG